jgi:hypothetical protein
MAVYKRHYKAYSGSLTQRWSRFLVITKFSVKEVFQTRALLAFFVACFIPILIEFAAIYISNSETAKALIGITQKTNPLVVDNKWFFRILQVQGWFAFMLTAWVGPLLVSPDLTNNALPLYLSRPLSRTEYVLGKMAVLMGLISCITWVPVLLLFALQASLAPFGWLKENISMIPAIVGGAWVWIIVLCFVAMAFSAWVKWRIIATALTVGVYFVPAGFGAAINEIMRTEWGNVFNLPYLVSLIWVWMFDVPARFAFGFSRGLPVSAAVFVLSVVCGACFYVLDQRLRGREVVRG